MKLYRVTTEGDCEGRTIKDLGIHSGNPAIIALNLADKAFYGLSFKEVVLTHHESVNTNTFSVHLSGFGTVPEFRPFDIPEGYMIEKSNFYDSLMIKQKKSVEDRRVEVATKALAKLTREERLALGLGK
jgi:hypothetical protein